MLFLTRKMGQSIIIENDIELTVVEIRGKTVKLGFNYPPEAQILRKEVYDRIQEENRLAAQQTEQATDSLAQVETISMPQSPKTSEKGE